MQLVVWIYVNTIFNINIVVGSVIYFWQDKEKKEWCLDVSGAYVQLMPIVFLLLLIGYIQMSYNIAI